MAAYHYLMDMLEREKTFNERIMVLCLNLCSNDILSVLMKYSCNDKRYINYLIKTGKKVVIDNFIINDENRDLLYYINWVNHMEGMKYITKYYYRYLNVERNLNIISRRDIKVERFRDYDTGNDIIDFGAIDPNIYYNPETGMSQIRDTRGMNQREQRELLERMRLIEDQLRNNRRERRLRHIVLDTRRIIIRLKNYREASRYMIGPRIGFTIRLRFVDFTNNVILGSGDKDIWLLYYFLKRIMDEIESLPNYGRNITRKGKNDIINLLNERFDDEEIVIEEELQKLLKENLKILIKVRRIKDLMTSIDEELINKLF